MYELMQCRCGAYQGDPCECEREEPAPTPFTPYLRTFGPFFLIDPGMVGVRAFGWQFDVTDHRKMPPLFSERYGYQRHPHIGPFCFRSGRLRKGHPGKSAGGTTEMPTT